jgi:parallel beta-helix repeat protein
MGTTGRLASLALGTAFLAVPLVATAAQAQTAAPHTVYVSANEHGADLSCGTAGYRTINAAIAAVSSGGTVVVCGGVYNEDVAVSKPLTLEGRSKATIDATKVINGVTVTADNATVSGFTVKNAIGEGILVNGADYVTLKGNVVSHNDLGGLPTGAVPNDYPACAAQGDVPGDCGEGIHLMGSSHSTVKDNVSSDNSGGILISDETGPAAHNSISGNVVKENLYACGITVVGHNPAAAPGGKPAPSVAGVYGNDVSGNHITGNGVDGAGAGVVIATPLPGGAVYDNTVEGNSISGNGMAGVTVHSHVAGQYLNGNLIRGNKIGTNNLNGDKDVTPADTETTGVLVGSAAPLSIEISGNVISKDHIGIYTAGPVKLESGRKNVFAGVAVHVSAN